MTEKYCIENDFAAQKELAEIERHNSEPIWEKNKALIARVARLEEASSASRPHTRLARERKGQSASS